VLGANNDFLPLSKWQVANRERSLINISRNFIVADGGVLSQDEFELGVGVLGV
jgi:hypothetical protein